MASIDIVQKKDLQKKDLDPEWVELIFLAKTKGFTIEEILTFLQQPRNKETKKEQPI